MIRERIGRERGASVTPPQYAVMQNQACITGREKDKEGDRVKGRTQYAYQYKSISTAVITQAHTCESQTIRNHV